ncbi:MAG: hypothetical protein ABJB01_07215 [Rudaea sp.]
MRNLILLALGIAIGVIGAVSALNALQQRDAYPRGLMNVMQYHYAALRTAVRTHRCGDGSTHVATLQRLQRDIESAIYPNGSVDAPFAEYDRRLGDALENVAIAGTDCSAFDQAVERVTAACDACHQQYR